MLESSVVSRRALVAAAIAFTAAPPRAPAAEDIYGDVYVGIRQSAIRSAQFADAVDRWQKKLYEDSRFGKAPPPDQSTLTLTPELARTINQTALAAYRAVVTAGSDAALARKVEDSAAAVFRGLTNSGREAVAADPERLGAGFNFVCLSTWLVFRESLSSPQQRARFESELGARLLDRLVQQDARACTLGGEGEEGGRARGLALARKLVGALERGGAVRDVTWQRTDDFIDGTSDTVSVLLGRSAWLDASLAMQTDTPERFHPDLVGAAVRACLERCAGLRTTHIEYYLDDVYRPDAEEYTPTQTLIEWSTS